MKHYLSYRHFNADESLKVDHLRQQLLDPGCTELLAAGLDTPLTCNEQ